jgi:hypothetical protein
MNGFAGKQFCRMVRKPGKMIEEPRPWWRGFFRTYGI